MLIRVIFTIMALASFQACASIGSVSAINGKAQILRDGHKLSVHLDSVIDKKDQIETADGAKVQIIFNDRTIVTVGENSIFSVPQYVYGDAKTSRVEFNLTEGVFKSMTGEIGKIAKQRFLINTATSTIGIRGTIYIVRVKGRETDLSTLEGATYMRLKSNGRVYEAPAGKSLTYNADTGVVTSSNLTSKTVMIQKFTAPKNGLIVDAKRATSGTAANIQVGSELGTVNKVASVANDAGASLGAATNTTGSLTGTVADTTGSLAGGLANTTGTPTAVQTPESDLHKVTFSDSYNTYGYWRNAGTGALSTPFTEKLVSSVPTYPSNGLLGGLLGGSKTASYTGNLVAISGTQSATGNLSMALNFGTGSVTGSMSNVSVNSHDWSNNFTGQVSASGVDVKNFTPSNASSNIKSISGELNGQLNGDNGQGVAGTFALTGTTSSGSSASVSGSYAAHGTGIK